MISSDAVTGIATDPAPVINVLPIFFHVNLPFNEGDQMASAATRAPKGEYENKSKTL